MAYSLHHVHIKAKDPRKTAQWYVDMFAARPLGEREVRGSLFVPVQVGSVTINISSPRAGDKMGPGDAETHFGLEHIGIGTDNIDRDLARLKAQGARIFEVVESPGSKLAFIEGPDSARIELIQTHA